MCYEKQCEVCKVVNESTIALRMVDKDGRPNDSAHSWPVYREVMCDACWKKRCEDFMVRT